MTRSTIHRIKPAAIAEAPVAVSEKSDHRAAELPLDAEEVDNLLEVLLAGLDSMAEISRVREMAMALGKWDAMLAQNLLPFECYHGDRPVGAICQALSAIHRVMRQQRRAAEAR